MEKFGWPQLMANASQDNVIISDMVEQREPNLDKAKIQLASDAKEILGGAHSTGESDESFTFELPLRPNPTHMLLNDDFSWSDLHCPVFTPKQ